MVLNGMILLPVGHSDYHDWGRHVIGILWAKAKDTCTLQCTGQLPNKELFGPKCQYAGVEKPKSRHLNLWSIFLFNETLMGLMMSRMS